MKALASIVTMIYSSLIIFFLSATPQKVSAQIDTIRLKDNRLNISALKPGMRQYLVYYQSPKVKKMLKFSLWFRNTQIETRNGEKVLVTRQNWLADDSTGYRTVYSMNRLNDFSPIYHSETLAGKNKSFNWLPNQVKGADTVINNTQKDFTLTFANPCYNWNLDIETFEMLPLAAGKTFAINFYDAGFGIPKYVVYKVVGSELLYTLDKQKLNCWILQYESEHNGQNIVQKFWISKKEHEFIKEEDSFGGNYRYKVKLPAYAFNLLTRY